MCGVGAEAIRVKGHSLSWPGCMRLETKCLIPYAILKCNTDVYISNVPRNPS